MAKISVTDAAFTGLRVVSKNPGAVIAWAVLQLLSMVGMTWFVLSEFGPVFTQLAATGQTFGPTNPGDAQARIQELMPVFHQVLPLYGYLILFALVLYSIFISAMNRAVLRPKESGLGFLRIGPDEFRQMIVMIAYVVLGVLFEIALFAAAILAAFGVRAALRATAPHAPNFIPFAVGAAIFLVGLVVVEVKLSLASAQTFDGRHINLFGSWRLTDGQVWPMIGTYLLAFLLYIVVAIIVAIVMVIALMITGALTHAGAGHMWPPNMGAMHLGVHMDLNSAAMAAKAAQPPFGVARLTDWKALAAYLTPMVVVQQLLNAVFVAILMPILLTPPAAIYKALTTETSRPTRTHALLNME